jgi:thiamine biosynthesis lipoprotein
MDAMVSAAIMAFVLNGTDQGLQRFAYSQVHMGGRVDITLYAETEDTAERAARAAFAEYARLEDIFSDYRPTSELMRLCARAGTGPVEVSPELFEILAFSQQVSEWTDGSFDVTASPVVRLWRTARQTRVKPTFSQRLAALHLVGWRNMVLDPFKRTVWLKFPGMQLDLGGIAKGYANDAALSVLRNNGVGRAMVEAGGDIGLSGPPPNALGWSIRVRGMSDTLYLKDCAISTSGDTEQFVEIEGVRYSHVVDPRSGLGVTTRVQATVIAPRGLTTDPLATALCVDPRLKMKLEDESRATILMTVMK